MNTRCNNSDCCLNASGMWCVFHNTSKEICYTVNKESNKKVLNDKSRGLKAIVYDYILSHGESSSAEIAAGIGKTNSTIRAYLSVLHKEKRIKFTWLRDGIYSRKLFSAV